MKSSRPLAPAPERQVVPIVPHEADANIRVRYAIERAAWVWHPRLRADEPALVRFVNRFRVPAATEVVLHVSADQRYTLSLDGRPVSRGPDRADLAHWSFASLRVRLPRGRHVLEADVWWLGADAPCAQVSRRGGFILAADGLEEQLDTGRGAWRAARIGGFSCGPGLPGHYHVIGPAFALDGARFHRRPTFVPVAVLERLTTSLTGIVSPGWQLRPTPLPEQIRRLVSPGSVRAVTDGGPEAPQPPPDAARAAPWQALLEAGAPVTVPAAATVRVLWDLADYYCGYSRVAVAGGRGATIAFEWAESLFEDLEPAVPRRKGCRDAVAGKRFWGFGDRFLPDGAPARVFTSPWWRAGRYVRLSVATGDEPLRLEALGFEETRYPLENEGCFEAAPGGLTRLIPLAVRGIQMCAHETFMDCPYYEQMMYVGDTRLEALTLYVMSRDERLPRRAIELFDWSRGRTGFVAERYPSDPFQLSLTFSALWVSMVRDYAYWRHDPAWVRDRLTGVRCLLEQFMPLLERDGLLGNLPGWSFVDWVPGWSHGNSPAAADGVSAPVNLLLLQALQHAADIEDACGEAAQARRWRAAAHALGARLVARCWDEARGLLADDTDRAHFSEHAQCLALLTGILDEARAARCLEGLLHDAGLARTTVYFSFYLFEVLQRFGRGDELVARMRFWEELVAQGFRTPVESPEPSRSDCHAWGSHPLFHLHASLAGVRPARPGFAAVRIAPLPGPLRTLRSHIPHPRGEVEVRLEIEGGRLRASVALPAETDGVLHWQGRDHPLRRGARTELDTGADGRQP